MRKLTTSLLTAASLALGAGGAFADTYSTGDGPGTWNPNDTFAVRYDTDGDGSLADEQTVMRTRAELEAENIDAVLFESHAIEAVDMSGDGRISASEWVLETPYDRVSLDLDNNGIPDGDE